MNVRSSWPQGRISTCTVSRRNRLTKGPAATEPALPRPRTHLAHRVVGADRSISACGSSGGRTFCLVRGVHSHGLLDEGDHGRLVQGLIFVEVDGTDRRAVKPGVEQLPGVADVDAPGKGQPNGVLQDVSDADDPVMRPD